MSASTPSPVVDLIEHAAKVIVDAREEPHTAPYHWAGALYRAGMLVAPGHGAPAAPVDGEDELAVMLRRAAADPGQYTMRYKDSDGDYELLHLWQARAAMIAVRPLLAARDAAVQLAETRFSFGTAAIKERDRAEAARDAAVQQMQNALADLREIRDGAGEVARRMKAERDDANERYEIAHESFLASESERNKAEANLAAAVERAERAEQRLRETEDSWEQLSGEYHAADVRAEQAEQRLQAVDVELTRWERHAPDGHPIEPRAIDYANRMRRVINAAVQLAETRFSFGTVAIKERDRAEADLAAAQQQLNQVRELCIPEDSVVTYGTRRPALYMSDVMAILDGVARGGRGAASADETGGA